MQRREPDSDEVVWIDYYQPTFARIHEEMETRAYQMSLTSEIAVSV